MGSSPGDDTGLAPDTGAGGDTGQAYDNDGGLGEVLWCGDLQSVYGTTFSPNDTQYSDWDGSGGEECSCPVNLHPDYTPDRLKITTTGSALNNGTPDPTRVPWTAGVVTRWGEPVTDNQTSWGEADSEWTHTFAVDAQGQDADGQWDGRISMYTRDRSYAACADYHDVRVTIEPAGRALPTPVFRKSSTAGAESDRDCVANQTSTTRFQLADFPGFIHPVPLASGGDSHYAGARLQSVTVTDWQNADELHLVHDGAEIILTPTNPSVQIQATDWWLGTNQWWGDRVADDQTNREPTVQLELQCPATPAAGIQTVPPGYALSLQQLDQASTTASGGVGLGSLITEAEDSTIPVYAVRVVPIEQPLAGGPTHMLRLELRGTWAGASLPLTQTGTDTWSLDTDGSTLDLQGTVTRGTDTLTLSLTGGTYETGAGPLDLQPTTLVLNVLGG